MTEDAAELSEAVIIPVGETLLSASAASAGTHAQERPVCLPSPFYLQHLAKS